MAATQRSGIGNGIWLCGICADKIDRDELRYTTPLLHDWRRRAETVAQMEQGKTLPTERELAVFRSKALGDNVTGHSIGQLISGVHEIAVHEIERVDPRFTGEIRADSEGVAIRLRPRETVPFTLSIPLSVAPEFCEKLTNLENHGHRLELEAAGIKIEGSPLFEEAFHQPTKFVMETHFRSDATQRITWTDVDSSKPMAAEFVGRIIGGRESVTYTGDLFGGLLQLKYSFPTMTSGTVNADIDVTISFSSWIGRSVRHLPYFKRFLSLCRAIAEGQEIGSSLEVNGVEWSSRGSINLMSYEELTGRMRFLDYVTKVREILEIVGTDVQFQLSPISEEDAHLLEDIWFLLCRMKWLRGKDLGLAASITVVPSKSGAKVLKASVRECKAVSIRVTHPYSGPLSFFGQTVPLGPVVIIWTAIVPKLEGNPFSIRPGIPAHLLLVPTDECTASVFFENSPPLTTPASEQPPAQFRG